jgi:hypothetical protein
MAQLFSWHSGWTARTVENTYYYKAASEEGSWLLKTRSENDWQKPGRLRWLPA